MEYSIYGLRVIETGEIIYIGSTKNLQKREYTHRINTETETKESNFPVYILIKSLGGWSSIEMDCIGIFNDENRFQTERDYIDRYNPRGNNHRPVITEEERKEKNKEWFASHPEYTKEYYQSTRQTQILTSTKWRENNNERYKENQKKWRADNKEKMRDYMREYRRKKKEENK
jgi:Tfp pilus tip-associated adhesin PilY1